MTILKTFVVFLISLPTLIFACASFDYGTYYIERGFNIMHKDLVGNEFRRVTNSQYISFYNEKQGKQTESAKQVNVAEWANYLKKSNDDAEAIIYQRKFTDTVDVDMQDYLAFIQQAEPLVDYEHSWDREKNKNLQQEYNIGIAVAEAALQKDISDFLKLRYLFGAMRLAHYSKQYSKEQALYENYKGLLSNSDSEVRFWIAALKAGMDKQQGKHVQAAYAFAQIFKQSKTKRYTAYVDFSIKNDTDWTALMALSKNDDEKALMHFIRALKPKANSLQELKQIYALAPDSVWLDALLARELEYVQFAKQIRDDSSPVWYDYSLDINKEILIDDTDQFSSNKQQKINKQKIARRTHYIDELSQIVQTIKTEGKHSDLFLTDFAEIYLRLLANKPVHLADVGQLQTKYADDPRATYIDPLKLFVYLENIPTVNAGIESEISTYLERIKKQENSGLNINDILAYSYIKLEPHYKENKAAFKHYISKHRGVLNPDNILVFELRDLKALRSQANKNFLEVQMASSAKNFLETHNSLDEITVKKYLSAGLFDKAEAILARLPEKKKVEWQEPDTRYSIFSSSLAGNNRSKFDEANIRATTKKLVEITTNLKNNPKDAELHHQLATAYYNMSWFGNSPLLSNFYRSTTNWRRGNVDLQKAKEHYQLAYKHASNDELKAKALYGLAKIEFNEKYMEVEKKGRDFYDFDFAEPKIRESTKKLELLGFGKYFKEIAQYKDTAYYNDVIKQCAIYNNGTSW